MIQQAKGISLYLRRLWYIISWAFVAFAVVAVFFLGLLPVLLQPLMRDSLIKIGRESDTARLRYVNPFYVQVDDFGYKTPAFVFSTKKVALDMSPSDWLSGKPGVVNITGYNLNIDMDRLRDYHLNPEFQGECLMKPLEDLGLMFFVQRMYIKDAVVQVTAGDIVQDYAFSLFSRLHDDGHFFSLQTSDASDSQYKVNGNFSMRNGSGNVNVQGFEKIPELWLEAIKTYTGITYPVDITFDHGMDFEAQLDLKDFEPDKWVLLGWQKGLNIAGEHFSAVVENLSFGSTGARGRYLQTSFMGDVGRAHFYGNDISRFSFELAQKNDDIRLNIPKMTVNATSLESLSFQWSLSGLRDIIPEHLNWKMGEGSVALSIQNANEFKYLSVDLQSVELANIIDLLGGSIQGECSGKASLHLVLMVGSGDTLVKELYLNSESPVNGHFSLSDGEQSVSLDNLTLEKRGKDVYLKSSGIFNGEAFTLDQSVLHFVPVLQHMLSLKGIQFILE